MLILTRKQGQALTLANKNGTQTMKVRVLEVRGKQVRLAIDAPSSIAIHRDDMIKGKPAGGGG